jgi:hypothetical protein
MAIGYCCCQMVPEPNEPASVVSTPAGTPEGPDAGVLTAEVPAGAAHAAAALPVAATSPPGPGPSPPRLSGAGFRC